MGITDIGNQEILFDYKGDATSSSFNKKLTKLLKPGIYEGGALSIDAVDDIFIAPFVSLIKCTTGELVKVSTTSVVSLAITEATPYVVVNLAWLDVEDNYAEFEAKAVGSLNANDVILGKGVYVLNVLTSFDYLLRTRGLIDENNNVNSDANLYVRGDGDIKGALNVGGLLTVLVDPSIGDDVGNRDYNDARYIPLSGLANTGTQNLIQNGNFEWWAGGFSASPDDWTFSFTTSGANPTVGQDGDGSVLITANAATTLVSFLQDILSEHIYLKGKTIQINIRLKTTSSAVDIVIDDGVTPVTTNIPLTGTYTDYPIEYTVDASATKLEIAILDITPSISINIQEVRLNQGEILLPFQKNIQDYIDH